jgi:outer membrane protein insertion porin family
VRTRSRSARARIQRLGFFETVSVKTRATAIPQVVDVIVEVKERTTGQFQVGMGFSSLDSFIGTAQIAQRQLPWPRPTHERAGPDLADPADVQGSFWEPYFLDTNVTFSIDLYRFDQLYSDFSRTSTGGSMSWGYRLTDTLLADIGYTVKSSIRASVA